MISKKCHQVLSEFFFNVIITYGFLFIFVFGRSSTYQFFLNAYVAVLNWFVIIFLAKFACLFPRNAKNTLDDDDDARTCLKSKRYSIVFDNNYYIGTSTTKPLVWVYYYVVHFIKLANGRRNFKRVTFTHKLCSHMRNAYSLTLYAIYGLRLTV